jgi:type II secretory pathway pseudopilin PulG
LSRATKIGLAISVVALTISIYANFIRDRQRRKENDQRAAEQARQAAERAFQERKAEQSRFFQSRLQEATVDNETAQARGTLLELEKDSMYHSAGQKYGQWMFARQLTTPQYLPLLYDAHLVHRHPPQFEEEGSSGMLWLVSGDGSRAAHTNDFEGMRYLIELLQKNAARKHGVRLDRFLYGRYSGVGFVTESNYDCTSLWVGADGEITVEVIAGVTFHLDQPRRIGDILWVRPSGTITIRGCPKRGEVIGFRENENGELWEQIIFPDMSPDNPDFKAQMQKSDKSSDHAAMVETMGSGSTGTSRPAVSVK